VWNGNVPLHQWKQHREYSVVEDRWNTDTERRDMTVWLFDEDSFVPVAMIKEGKSYSILTDQLGTPTEAYDTEGNEVWSRVLDMDGNVIEETGNKGMVPFLFQGQYYDRETGLAYNRFRYYSPKMGMYVSQDPIGLASGEPNFYAYVSDSNQLIDPFGLAHLNSLTAKANFKLYIIYEDATKTKVLKIGKAKSDDVMPTLSNKNRRMHNSERAAKRQYPNAFAEEYRDLGYTSTRKAIGAEAKEVRKRRNKGERLPLNREKKKSYQRNS
jgi:RHS repeat-associated protein